MKMTNGELTECGAGSGPKRPRRSTWQRAPADDVGPENARGSMESEMVPVGRARDGIEIFHVGRVAQLKVRVRGAVP